MYRERVAALLLLFAGLATIKMMIGTLGAGYGEFARARLAVLTRASAGPSGPAELFGGEEAQDLPVLLQFESLAGEVFAIDSLGSDPESSQIIEVMLETQNGMVVASLGPQWRLEEEDFQVRPHDFVQLSGVRTVLNGEAIFLVAEIRNGQQRLETIDPDELLAWTLAHHASFQHAVQVVNN